jgi:hypothetical protein
MRGGRRDSAPISVAQVSALAAASAPSSAASGQPAPGKAADRTAQQAATPPFAST